MDGFDDTVCPGAISFPWPVMLFVWPVVIILFPFYYGAALARKGKQLWVKVTGNHEFVRFERWWWGPLLGRVQDEPDRVVCSCGWKSPIIDSDRDALMALFEEHARGTNYDENSHS
jgi:hypothetical protein